jgi:probable F420-dependent oxidoreductase
MKFTVSVAMSQPDHYCALAVAAEECGFSSVAVPDSIFYSEQVSAPYPYTQDGQRMWDAHTPWIDPFVAIAAMAAVTRKVRFYTNVLKLGVRNPLLVAKTLGSTAVLSGNRVGLGAGLGWLPEEFAWCGQSYETRGKRVDEALEILRLVLGGGMVEYHGQHYDFAKLQMSPAPTEPVPIYIGGHTGPGLRRAAKYGDGWTSAMMTEQEIVATITELRRLLVELGRGAAPFEIQAVCTDVHTLDGYRRLAAVGVTDLITLPWLFYAAGRRASLEQKKDGMKRFADDIIAKMR